ncbi:S41 family peptidase [Streptomyces bathyalis]|uniref:S41 family peptidase n=1 Tax=Streptomyces bathyalis TaxID=2710756 RepID=A0A7T1WS76_9ACTN|nr:S41 family peptidase [Streptomyces bathyalis]QPP08888.1 S41 family peptidase [Streptomyces bathyalis]
MEAGSSFGTAAKAMTAAAVVLALTGSAALSVASAQEARHSAGADRHAKGPAAGVWRMDGYGTVLTVGRGGKRVQEYQTTGVSCLKGASAERVRGGGGAARYETGDGESFTLRGVGGGGHRASMHVDGSPGDRHLRRVGELPGRCGIDVPGNDPVATFDVFWQTFEENYPFFAAKGIDWHAVRDRFRPRIDEHTSRKELFAVFREMVAPLHDAHVAVLAGDTGSFAQVRPGTRMPTAELDAKVREFIEQRDLEGRGLREFAGGRIGYADLPGGQGYLRVSGFTGYTEDGDHAADRAELGRALDAVLTKDRTARLQGLIVDLRINGGGSDSLGLELAARLTGRPHFAYAKAARNDPADPAHFTGPQPVYVRPVPERPRYTGPVAVLTGGSTLSAGETFTQALMERPGRTVRIGEHTQGVFSDTLERRLPNGWSFLLPNEEFRTRDGRTFDGTGIPPHIAEPVFTDEEFEHDRDSAFDRAVAELGRDRR